MLTADAAFVLDVATGKPTGRLPLPVPAVDLATSPREDLLALSFSSKSRAVRLFRLPGLQEVALSVEVASDGARLSFDGPGARLGIAENYDQKLHILHLQKEQIVSHSLGVARIAPTPDGFLLSLREGPPSTLDPGTGKATPWRPAAPRVKGVALDDRATTLLVADDTRRVLRITLPTSSTSLASEATTFWESWGDMAFLSGTTEAILVSADGSLATWSPGSPPRPRGRGPEYVREISVSSVPGRATLGSAFEAQIIDAQRDGAVASFDAGLATGAPASTDLGHLVLERPRVVVDSFIVSRELVLVRVQDRAELRRVPAPLGRSPSVVLTPSLDLLLVEAGLKVPADGSPPIEIALPRADVVVRAHDGSTLLLAREGVVDVVDAGTLEVRCSRGVERTPHGPIASSGGGAIFAVAGAHGVALFAADCAPRGTVVLGSGPPVFLDERGRAHSVGGVDALLCQGGARVLPDDACPTREGPP